MPIGKSGTSVADYQKQAFDAIAAISVHNKQTGHQLSEVLKQRNNGGPGYMGGFIDRASSGSPWGKFVGGIVEGAVRFQSILSEPFRLQAGTPDDPKRPPWEDMWRALKGDVQTSWSTNLASYGMAEDSKIRGMLGLGLDIALDPIVWATFGAGALPKTGVATLARRTVTAGTRELMESYGAKSTAELVERMGSRVVKPGEVAEHVTKGLKKGYGKRASDEIADLIGGLSEEALQSILGSNVNTAIDQVSTFLGKKAADAVLKTGSLKGLRGAVVDPLGRKWMPKEITSYVESAARFTPKQVDDIAIYALNRYAQGALGGIRFRASIPFGRRLEKIFDQPWLAYRWQSKAIPIDARLTNYNAPGNFFRGKTALGRLHKMVENPTSTIGPDDVKAFFQGGPKGQGGKAALKLHLERTGRGAEYDKVFGNFMTSSYQGLSEVVGTMTEAITPGAREWRRLGYAGMKAHEGRKMAAASSRDFISRFQENAQEWVGGVERLYREEGKAGFAKLNSYIENAGVTRNQLPDYIRDVADDMIFGIVDGFEYAVAQGANIHDATKVWFGNTVKKAQDTIDGRLRTLRRLSQEDINSRGVDEVLEEVIELRRLEADVQALGDPDALKAMTGKEIHELKGSAHEVLRKAEIPKTGGRLADTTRKRLTKTQTEVTATKRQIQKMSAEGAPEEEISRLSRVVADKEEELRTLTEVMDGLNALYAETPWYKLTFDEAGKRMESYRQYAARVGVDVPAASPTRYFPRRFSKEYREYMHGQMVKGGMKAREAKLQTANLERKMADLSLEEAEAAMRKARPEVPGDIEIFESNPLAALDQWANEVGNAIYSANVDKTSRSILREIGAVDNSIALPVDATTAKGMQRRITELRRKINEGVIDADTATMDWIDRVTAWTSGADDVARKAGNAGDFLDEAAFPAVSPKNLPRKVAENQEALAKEVNLIMAGVKGVDAAPMKTAMAAAAEATTDMRGFARLYSIPGLEDTLWHPLIAEEFAKGWRRMGQSTMHQAWRQFVQGPWKRWATIYWLGFHVRNAQGAWFNNWLGGVGLHHYLDTVELGQIEKTGRAKIPGRPHKTGKSTWRRINIEGQGATDISYDRLLKMTNEASINRFNGMTIENHRRYAATANPMTATAKRRPISSKVPGGVKFLNAWEKGAVGIAGMTENLFRRAAFMKGLEETADVASARAFTMMRHGDYGELTATEDIIRDLVPFYKWTRMNLPFQVRSLMENPGRSLAAIKTQQALIPPEERQKLPFWMQGRFIVPRDVFTQTFDKDEPEKTLILDLPLSDLTMRWQEMVSMFLPQVTPFVESLLLKKSIFTGAPLEGRPQPIPGWAHALGLDKIAEALGVGTRNAEGELTVPETTYNIMRVFPPFARFHNFLTGAEGRERIRMNTVASVFFGMGLRPIGEKELTSEEIRFVKEEIEPHYRQLQDLGFDLSKGKKRKGLIG